MKQRLREVTITQVEVLVVLPLRNGEVLFRCRSDIEAAVLFHRSKCAFISDKSDLCLCPSGGRRIKPRPRPDAEARASQLRRRPTPRIAAPARGADRGVGVGLRNGGLHIL